MPSSMIIVKKTIQFIYFLSTSYTTKECIIIWNVAHTKKVLQNYPTILRWHDKKSKFHPLHRGNIITCDV